MIYLFVLDDSLTSKRFITRTDQLTKCYGVPLQMMVIIIIIIIIIIIMSLFKEDDIFSTKTNLTYGPLKSKTYLHGYMVVRLCACKIDLNPPPPDNFILLIVPRRYFCCGSICLMYWSRIFVLFEPYVRAISSGNSDRLFGNSCSLGLRYVF